MSIADASIADVSLLAAEPTELIMNNHTTGYGSERKEGGSVSIGLHEGSEQGSTEHVGAAAGQNYKPTGKHGHPPEIHEAQAALDDIKKILRPPREKGPSYKDPGLDELLRGRLEGM